MELRKGEWKQSDHKEARPGTEGRSHRGSMKETPPR
jgi:hypothetical protein